MFILRWSGRWSWLVSVSTAHWVCPMLSVEKNVYMARLAEQAERYEEMCAHMKEVALEMEPLGIDERNLLAAACHAWPASGLASRRPSRASRGRAPPAAACWHAPC